MRISIHAPRAGRDLFTIMIIRLYQNFNPRAPCGARPSSNPKALSRDVFQSTRPVRGATGMLFNFRMDSIIFQSTRPVRGATAARLAKAADAAISIHAPRAGRDRRWPSPAPTSIISIHAPRAGRDPGRWKKGDKSCYFNPRAPCGARPGSQPAVCGQGGISIHAPRAGRDGRCTGVGQAQAISIHAPRAGRDGGKDDATHYHKISIHAPRAGRDYRASQDRAHAEISIHAPRAGRDNCPLRIITGGRISIHAPRAGRDSKSIQNYFTHFCDKRQFLDNFTQNAAF